MVKESLALWGFFPLFCDLLTESFSWNMFLFHSALHPASRLTRTASTNSKIGRELECFLPEEFTDLGKVILNNIKWKDILNVLWHEITIIILKIWKLFNGSLNLKTFWLRSFKTFQLRSYNQVKVILKWNSKCSHKAKSRDKSLPRALNFMCFLMYNKMHNKISLLS